MRRVVIAAPVAVVVVVGVALLSLRGGDGETRAMIEEAFCETLVELDVGHALGGDNSLERVVAVAELARIGAHAPPDVRDAVMVIAELAAEQPMISEVARHDLDDPDARGAAFQAVYTLSFDPDFRVAAALVERHAIQQCGMAPSGRFDLELDVEFDPTRFPGLDLAGYEDPTFEFDETQFEPYTLSEIEDPTFEFDDGDWGRFGLDGGG